MCVKQQRKEKSKQVDTSSVCPFRSLVWCKPPHRTHCECSGNEGISKNAIKRVYTEWKTIIRRATVKRQATENIELFMRHETHSGERINTHKRVHVIFESTRFHFKSRWSWITLTLDYTVCLRPHRKLSHIRCDIFTASIDVPLFRKRKKKANEREREKGKRNSAAFFLT